MSPPVTLTWKQRLRRIIYFFPVQLLLLQLKSNHVLLLFWALLFGYVTKVLAINYGIPYLFLYPEYLNSVNIISHIILGFSCGGFIIAFNITSYTVNASRFPFIATLARPFVKYCINNSLIPLVFIGVYIYQIVNFQLYIELEPLSNVLLNVAGFILGNLIFIILSLSYFVGTNKNLFKLFGIEEKKEKRYHKEKDSTAVKDVFHKKVMWYNFFPSEKDWKVETYLTGFFSFGLARDSSHYDKKMLEGVFAQNHVNASLFQVLIIITILGLGTFREINALVIPAGASIFLLLSMFLMLSSALFSWLKGWTATVIILLFFLLNHLSKYETFNYTTYAYGMDYSGKKAEYSNENLQAMRDNTANYESDVENGINILNNWRLSNAANTLSRKVKPKLVIVNTSGGGLRSSMWTFHTLQYADSLLNGELLRHTHMFSGSSGGMIGAAYLREIYHRSQSDSSISIHADSLIQNIGRDVLNPLAYTITVNDLFVRMQSFSDNNHSYTKDRGYAFEEQLNHNTNGVLKKRLKDYTELEKEAKIPLMFFTPTIINDGRRLIISSQPVSYLTNTNAFGNVNNQPLAESVELTRFFKDQDAENLRFTSALRMNATFPYVMPVTSLPSSPSFEVMDAGIRDNYGLMTSIKYLYTFRNWISSNTSGVIFIQIRDKSKEFDISETGHRTLLQSLISPLGSFYLNWPNVQTFTQDELLQYASSWFDGPIDLVNFELQSDRDEHISLSWHLTNKEKRQILQAIHQPENKASLKKLQNLME